MNVVDEIIDRGFLAPGQAYTLLPGGRRVRTVLNSQSPSQRWQDSRFHIATRLTARALREVLRIKAGLGFSTLVANGRDWPLGAVLADIGAPSDRLVVTVGTSGPTQKAVVRALDDIGRVCCVLKVGWSDAAIRRLAHEETILRSLDGVRCPSVIGSGLLGSGRVLVLSGLNGRPGRVALAPEPDVVAILESLAPGSELAWDSHPWSSGTKWEPDVSRSSRRMLRNRVWPVVVMHGDLAPWNVIRTQPEGVAHLIDWEHASLVGFPHIDHVYHILQVARLIRRASPRKALEILTTDASGLPAQLNSQTRVALAEVTSRWTVAQRLDDGLPVGSVEIQWWRAVATACGGD